jgi:monovalent cation:H+ antiporter-2, CPA2 family
VGISRVLFSRSDETLLLTVLGLAILVAGIAELVEISAAVGALLIGIVLSGPAAHGARQVLTPLRDLFAALFFVFIGLRVNPATLPASLAIALALGAIGIATKMASGWVGGGWTGMDRVARVRAATALIPRGEFSLAIAALGVAAGLTTRLQAVTVAYVMVLAILGPVIARVADVILARRVTPETQAPSATSLPPC